MENNQASGDCRKWLWSKQPKWHDDLNEMTEKHGKPVHHLWQAMEIPAQRIRQRLCLIVVKEAGQLTPASVVTQLDQTRAKFGPEKHPSQD